MNRFLSALFLTVAVLVTSVLPAPAQTISTISKGTPLNTTETPITGFTAFATPTLTFGASDVAKRMTPVPANTIAVTVVASGAVNYGSSAVVADTTTTAHHLKLTDGQTVMFRVYPGTPQPDIWFVPTATGATNVGVRFIAHTQR